MSGIKVEKISDYIGAEIHNVDLSKPLADQERAIIRQALADNGVIFFRDQSIEPAQHVSVASIFGEPMPVSIYSNPLPGFPMIGQLTKAEDDYSNIGGGWHADRTYEKEPPAAAVLVARELPDRGGDTLFSSMAAAYDALSIGLQQALEGLNAVHSAVRIHGKKVKNPEDIPEVIHPVIIRHPITGRPSLFVNRAYTLRFEGWTERESTPLLEYLGVHGQRPEFQCRFKWHPGSIAVWDNAQVWHYAANDYQGRRRAMHRIAIKGATLAPAGPQTDRSRAITDRRLIA